MSDHKDISAIRERHAKEAESLRVGEHPVSASYVRIEWRHSDIDTLLARIDELEAERDAAERAEHVAWCRYTGRTIVTCDSDTEGAFRVYRHAELSTGEKLRHRINFLEQNETVVWEVLELADGSTIHDVAAAVFKLRAELAAANQQAEQAAAAERDRIVEILKAMADDQEDRGDDILLRNAAYDLERNDNHERRDAAGEG